MNILFDRHVRIEDVGDKRIIVIEVPRADRTQKPIYLNEKPFAETYRRNGEGDFHCSESLVRAMFRDNGHKTQDMLVVEKKDCNAIDIESLDRYRNRMKATRPGHVWIDLKDNEFMQKIGAVDVGEDNELHPTAAGLLMFGYEYEILSEYPQYFLDYQEHFDTSVRWTDRVYSSSGEWSGNLYDFFFKVYNKLIQNHNIKIPFKIDGVQRVEDTPVHKAIREALANCLTNADYYGSRGLVIRNNPDELIFENPGGFRISLDEAKNGGVSVPRNSAIFKMFSLLDIGERAGSGIPNIIKTWEDQGWAAPIYTELFDPERTILKLSFKSGEDIINSDKNEKVAIKSGDKRKVAISSGDKQKVAISEIKKQAIVDYLAEHDVCKTSDLTALLDINVSRTKVYLQELIADGFVVAEGANRNRTYRLK
jgi:predicted HTH transcriptional regulator